MVATPELPATTVSKLRTLVNQGERHLDEINAALRRAQVESSRVEDMSDLGFTEPMRGLSLPFALSLDEREHGRLAKAAKWAGRADATANGYLDQDLAKQVTRHGLDFRGGDALERSEKIRRGVLGRVDSLRAIIGNAAPTPAGADRDSSGGWRHIRDLGLVDPAVLDGYLKTMRARTTAAERRAAVGAAKELFEATLKGALHRVAPTCADLGKDDLPALWKKAVTHLHLDRTADPVLGGQDLGVIKILNGLNTAVAGFAELRNKAGTGHGRPTAAKGLTETHVVLLIDSIYAVTRFMTGRLRDLDAKGAHA